MRKNCDKIRISGTDYVSIQYVSETYGIPESSIRTIIKSSKGKLGVVFGASRLLTDDDVKIILSRRGRRGDRYVDHAENIFDARRADSA